MSFDAEHDKYWEMVLVGRQHDVDPVWLALYSMVSWNAFERSGRNRLPFLQVLALSLDGLKSRLPGDDARAACWYAGSQRLLQLGDYLGKPQIRTVLYVLARVVLRESRSPPHSRTIILYCQVR